MKPYRQSRLQAQRGVATLVVVMVLFFIVSLVAAYTNRNLIFEQRTSANQYRSTQALEAAEAGVEWALAMLNHGRITATCATSASAGDTSFRQRYIDTDSATGNLTARLKGTSTVRRSQSCVLNGTQWDCSCPEDADPSPPAPSGGGLNPAFRVRFEDISSPPSQPGVIRLHAVGCTKLDVAGCLDFDSQGVTNEGRAAITVLVALTGNAASPPAAAVLARDAINFGAAASVYNTSPTGSGITLHAGAAINTTNVVLHSNPGTPGSQSIVAADPALNLAAVAPFSAEDRMFATVFNMTAGTFREQPAAVQLTCGAGTCVANDVRSAITLNPGRPIWIPGHLTVDTAGDIGSLLEPVLLIVEGNLSFTTAATIHGLVYVRTADWVTSGAAGQVRGAVVAQGEISGTGTPSFVYDSDVLRLLRYGTGSFVRVPGSWKDFR
jgi:hypothetical protein